MRFRPVLALIVCGLLPALACATRTTPLPPPAVSEISSPDNAGNVTLTGTALEGASIGVINSRTLDGVIGTSARTNCDSACPFTIVLAADGGDTLRVWQFFEIEDGEDVSVPK